MKVFTCEQGSAAWYECRRGIVTASNFGRILTPKTGKLSAQADELIYELIAEKYHLGDMSELSGPETFAMRQGVEREPTARAWYELDTNATVRQVGFCLSDCGRYGASPDGMIGDEGVLELKCPQGRTHVKYLMDGGLPDAYKWQVHGHLVVTGAKWCDFLSYAEGMPSHLVRIEPDEDTEKLRKALEAFCDRYDELLQKFETTTGATLAAA